MRRELLLLVALFLPLSSCAPRPNPAIPAEAPLAPPAALARVSDEYWRERLRVSPLWATYLGDRSRDADLHDPSDVEHERHLAALRGFRAQLGRIDRAKLGEQERITADVLDLELSNALELEVCRERLWTIDPLNGPQVTFPELPSYHTVKDEKNARDLGLRYRAMKKWYEQHAANLRRGVAGKRVAPRIVIEKVRVQLDGQLAIPPEKSPYYADAVKGFPAEWSPDVRASVEKELLASVKEGVYPGLQAFRDVIVKELLPAARDTIAVTAMPDGAACYEARVRASTGTAKTPDELHQLGLDEVARIRAEMTAIIRSGRGGTDVRWFLDELKKRPEQYLKSEEQLLDYNRALVKRATDALPRAFTRLPKTPIELKPIEAFRAKESPAGYYYNAPKDGSRPAYYYLNTHDPASRPLYNMAALAFHEAVPGHHLQIALANENEALPEFQRQLGQTAFVEGWALYSEGLAGELGLYLTREEKLGALGYESWRAVRLVVDTGMHAKGWSRDKALRYFLENTTHSEGEAIAEIDRYITWPGQALAYKVGQLEIRAMRADAEKALGPKFDLRAFHDRLLSHGAVPMTTARRDIEAWIAETKAKASPGDPAKAP